MALITTWSKANLHPWNFFLANSSYIGTLGELAVRKELLRQDYKVYIPESDTAQVDLVIELGNGSFKRVQVKTINNKPRGTAVEVRLKKYVNTDRVDVVAVYYRPKDIIAFVPYNNEKNFILALETGKNNQKKNRTWFYQYERFPEFS